MDDKELMKVWEKYLETRSHKELDQIILELIDRTIVK